MTPELSSRQRRWISLVFAALLLGTLWWRWTLVGLGPDPDSDAYGHHAIARQILVQPTRLAVHWVWLPLFHWLQAPLVALGAGLEHVRRINVVLWAGVPLLLFVHLRQRYFWVAWLSACLCVLCPIGMQMGTTGQPEPLFTLAVLAFAVSMQRGFYVVAALSLTLASMLRYEAWALVVFAAGWLVLSRGKGETLTSKARWKRRLVFVLPAAIILLWALVRWPGDGRLFGFVAATGKFAREAQGVKSVADLSLGTHLQSVLHYPWKVAVNVLGWSILFVPMGFAFLWQKERWFFVTGAGCLAFISFSWLMRSSLGLDRHFVSVVPFYAVSMASGMIAVARFIASRLGSFRFARAAGFTVLFALSLASLGELSYRLRIWMGHWKYNIEHSYPDRIEVANYLKKVATKGRIYCDESTVEILSHIDRRRFDRRGVHRQIVQDAILGTARDQGRVYVASWIDRMKPLLPHGKVVFRPKGATQSAGMAVLRIEGD